ncbi:MAG: hypothetical protein WCF24_08135 [Acidimicrobiales bacterium]
MTLLHPNPAPTYVNEPDAEALIKEARRLRRRRWMIGSVATVLAATLAGVLYGVNSHTSPPPATTLTSANRPLVNAKAFSHEGELAFVSRNALWVLDGANGSLREVTANYAIEPVFSPNGKWLAYVTTGPPALYGNQVKAAPNQLWIAHANGTDAHAVRGLVYASGLSWSPTTETLAVIEGTVGSAKSVISLVTPGGSTRQLPGTSEVSNFVWSPNGKEIAFSGEYQDGALEAVSVSGGSPVVWQPEHNNPAYPKSFNPTIPAAWLPDGEGIVYWIDQDNSASLEADGLPLYLVTDPNGPAHLLGTTLVNAASIATSPDGSLAIASGGDRYQWSTKAVERCSIATATCTKVPIPSSDISFDPSWSPDGSQLVYVVGPSNQSTIGQSAVAKWYSELSLWTVKKDSDTPTELRGTRGGTVASWSPNGKSFLFEANDALWLRPTPSSSPVEIASPLFPENDWPSYYAEVNWNDQFSWSPR